jgi:hypothetical protein
MIERKIVKIKKMIGKIDLEAILIIIEIITKKIINIKEQINIIELFLILCINLYSL